MLNNPLQRHLAVDLRFHSAEALRIHCYHSMDEMPSRSKKIA